MPDTPTMREAGFPGLEATNWSGFVIPAAAPSAVIARINSEVVRALGTSEVRESMRIQGMTPAPGTPEQFAELLRTDAARFAKVVREAKVTVD